MDNARNILNIDTLDLTNVDNYTLIDTLKNTPFPSILNQNDIHEDMLDRFCEEVSIKFFIDLVEKYPETFVLSNITGGSTPEIEYEKLSYKIKESISELKLRKSGLSLTGISLNATGNPTEDYTINSKKINFISNEKLLFLIQSYIEFQKNNNFPSSTEIVITNSDDMITFSLTSNIIGDSKTAIIMTPDKDVMDELDTFSEFIDQIIEDLTEDEDDVYCFKKLSRVSDYAVPTMNYKTRGLFKCMDEKLSTFYTGSLTDKNKKYYIPIYNNPQNSEDSYHQFDISFAHISGSGSKYIENGEDLLPSKTMYRKYLLECFGTNKGKFKFKNGKNGDYFYAIQIDRDLFKDRLDPGNFQLYLSPLSSSANQLYNTGSNFSLNQTSDVIYTLIDESKDTAEVITDSEGIYDYYYVTSGSLQEGVYGDTDDDAWGIVFPKMGLIILDGVVLDQSCSFNTVTASIDGDNIRKLFISISGSSVQTLSRTQTGSFFARSTEESLVETYFCRANYYEFNYSNNYTYITGSKGEVNNLMFRREPNSYITSIGLYNRNNELVAVGKLPQPLLKNAGTEYIFQVRLRLN
jgi:hypothetical protein